MRNLKNIVATSKGAALVEYGILVGLIAVAAIAAVLALGETISGSFSEVASQLDTSLNSARAGL